MVVPGIVLFDDVNAEHWAKRIIRDSNREIITSQTGKAMRKVAFICRHNSCRSQIAEALGKHLRGTDCDFYSAGVETKPQINQDAVRLMKELYGIDMEKKQYSKLISSIPEPDISISMGCDVGCPFIGRVFDDNWKLEDPTGKTDDDFRVVIQQIEKNILELKKNDCDINSN